MNVFVEALKVVPLDKVHALPIEPLDSLPNLPSVLVMVSKIELLAPVAEVCRNNEESALLIEIRSKNLPIILSHLLVHWSCENGNYLDVPSEGFYDEGKMHLDTVLVFVIVYIQHVEALLGFKLINYLDIDGQRTHWSAILIQISQSTPWKIFVMRGAKYEDSLNFVRASNILIGPSGSRPTEIQSSVGSNQAFYPLFLLVLLALSPVYVLAQLSA
jgi:hypothetical protein